jgi:hypothetical protein
MRRPDLLDPAVAADLDALDAALAGEADADAALVLLAADVRAGAPRPTDAFRERLDARVREGFPGAPRRAPRSKRGWRRALMPAAGFAAAAALVAVIVVARPDTSGQSAGSMGSGGGTAASASAAGSTASPAQRLTGAAPAPGRRVQRDVRLDLRTPAARFEDVSDAIVRATQRAGGFVAGSQVTREGGRGSAAFELQIPAGRLDAAVADLSRLAHVRAIEQSTQDVTGQWDTVARRLIDASTQRRALVAALATASGPEAIRLRGRLDRADARVRSLTEQRRRLARSTRYGSVYVTLTGSGRAAAAAPSGGAWTPGDAWHDARRALEVLAGVAIIALALAVPLALAAAAVALGAQAVRRRRREAALGAG